MSNTTALWGPFVSWVFSALTADVCPSLTTRALVRPDTYYATLWDADLLCYVCTDYPWTRQARWCSALICEGCAEGEPNPEED